MKKFAVLLLLMMGYFVQAQQESNPFLESEKTTENAGQGAMPEVPTGGPGNGPGDGDPLPTPIDDYLPALAIAAVGIIVYTVRKKKDYLTNNP